MDRIMRMQEEIRASAKETFNLKIQWATVESYDPATNSVSVSLFGSNLGKERSVSFTSSCVAGGGGLAGPPQKGDFAIVTTTLNRDYIILGFVHQGAPLGEPLVPGDISIQTPSGSSIKIDADGDIHLMSASGAIQTMTASGGIITKAFSSNHETLASITEDGLIDGKPYAKKIVFGQIPGVQYNGIEELESAIMGEKTLPITGGTALITEESGVVMDGAAIAKIGGIDLVYRIKSPLAAIAFDAQGNVHVTSKTGTINFHTNP